MKKKPLVILTGPTAVGKTQMSIALAKKINGAIISADSMQIYRYMDIGSAKIQPEEMDGIRHYLVDVLLPWEEFHIVRFKEMAQKALEEIYEEGKIPIVVGGTGFYIQALLYDICFGEQERDDEYRQKLQTYADKNGACALHQRLRAVDPASAEAIHENNIKRVIRALEYHHLTGNPISAHNEEERRRTSPYNFAYFVLTDDRSFLYQQIDRRVDRMMEKGLLAEVEHLKELGCRRDMVSMQGLGYKELFDYLEGRCSLEEAVYIIKRETRHFAKRQLTWFKRERDVIWLNRQEFPQGDPQILHKMCEILAKRRITERNDL